MVFIIVLFVCLILLGLLADKLVVPFWGWLLLLAGAVCVALLLAGSHWLWYLLVLAPSVAMAFPQVRLKLLVRPWLDKLASHYLHNKQDYTYINVDANIGVNANIGVAAKDDWLSDIMLANQDSLLSPITAKSLPAKELKVIYQYYHRLQILVNKRSQTSEDISGREILQEIHQVAGLGIDTAYGGEGLSIQARYLLLLKLAAIAPKVAEELANMNCGIASLLSQYASPRQKESILPALAAGKILCHTLDPRVSQGWSAKKIQQSQQPLSNPNPNQRGKNIKNDGIEIQELAKIKQAIKHLDADLVAIYVQVKFNSGNLNKLDNTNEIDRKHNGNSGRLKGCWVLLDDKTIEEAEEAQQENKTATNKKSNLFIPDALVIYDDSNNAGYRGENENGEDGNGDNGDNKSLLKDYLSEKSVYITALNTASNLVRAHKSSSSMANLIAAPTGKQLDKNQITAAANQWQDAWFFKQLGHVHLHKYLDKQTSCLIDSLICYENSQPPSVSSLISPIHNLLEKSPPWHDLVKASVKQMSDNERLAAMDNWLGNFISNLLRVLYLGVLGYLMLLIPSISLISSLLPAYGNLTDKQSGQDTNTNANANISKNRQNRQNNLEATHYELLKSCFALLVDCSVISMVLAGKTTNLLNPLKHLYYAYIIVVHDNGSATTAKGAKYHGEAIFFHCKQQLYQAFRSLAQDSPMPVSILPWLANILLSLSPSHRLRSSGEDYQIINYSSIPSQERNDFFAEIELTSPPFAELEEQVKLSWLVREIYSNLEGEGYSYLDPSAKNLTLNEWHVELLKAELITREDHKILEDFHNNFSSV
ncbi:MAG: acyl-CoA dehydrogenase family protein [Candidatus Portiera sp.]|nr:acyl-CoA dehydrogenase family protein [Portiera sp.]